MDPNNPVSSNSGQFDVNAAFIKQQQQQLIDADLQHADFDLNRVVCGMARNGKHQDSDGNDDDYDYDLGPETDVDDGEDATDVNRSLEPFVTSSSSREFAPDKSPMETEVDDEGNNKEKEEDLLNRDNANCPVDSVINDVSDNRVISSDKDILCDERSHANNDDDNDNEARVESTTGTHTLVDDDKSPPSPRDASKCTLSVVKTHLCAAMVYGYAYRAVSNLFMSLTNYISASFATHVFGLRRKWMRLVAEDHKGSRRIYIILWQAIKSTRCKL